LLSVRNMLRVASDPVERGMQASILEASFFTIWAGAVTGNYLMATALYRGASGVALGVLGGLAPLATMLQLISAPLVLGRNDQRTVIANLSGLQRFSAAAAGLIALWLMPSPAAVWVFVALHVFAWACMAPATVLWQGYMTDLVPERMRGGFFSRRHIWGQLAGISAVLLYGVLLERLPGARGFAVLSACALVAAALNYGAWTLHPDLPPGDARPREGFWATIRVPLSRPGPHRVASLYFAAWAFAQGLAVPFFPVALVRMLDLSLGTVSLLATTAAIASILSARAWGRWLDRAGQGDVLSLATGVLAVVPALLLAARIGGLPVLAVAYLLFGAGSVGYGLSYQTLNMRLAPKEGRGAYFAFFAAMGGITGFLTPVVAGPFTDRYLSTLLVAATVLSLLLWAAWQVRVRHLVLLPPEERG
jgi:MFS family permease